MKKTHTLVTRIFGVLLLGMVLSGLTSGTALAATKTWTGSGGDSNFNTSGNWSPSGAPTNGDDLVFPQTATNKTPNNNISSLSIGNISFTGSGFDGYTLSGNALTLTGGITSNVTGDGFLATLETPITVSGSQTWSTTDSSFISIDGALSGSGAITKTGTGVLYLDAASPSYSGAITLSGGYTNIFESTALGASSAGTTLASGAVLTICGEDDMTIAEPLTIGGTGVSSSGALSITNSCAGGNTNTRTLTLSGAVALTANTTVSGHKSTLRLTGALSGNYTIGAKSGTTLTLELAGSSNTTQTPNGTYASEHNTVTVAAGDSQPSTRVDILENNTYVIDGVRGEVVVYGGFLKGTGTVGSVNVSSGGTISPGHSPGCLNTGDIILSGTYAFELGGTTACSGYDQIVVTGIVTAGGNLSISLYNDFKPTAGQTYTIINNDGSDAVVGTFTGLAEGATMTVNGYVFRVSYVGGDGNDITLTVVSVPSVPNTGIALVTGNPLVVTSVAILAAITLLVAGRKYLFSKR